MILVLGVICFMASGAECGLLVNAWGSKCQLLHCPAAPAGCHLDVLKDLQGCPVTCDYTCGAPWCGPRPCNLICNHGYVEDAMGCTMCQCQGDCRHTHCRSDCPTGYQTDSNNCPTCACKPDTHACNFWSSCSYGFCPDSCKCQPDCFDAYPLPDNPVILAL